MHTELRLRKQRNIGKAGRSMKFLFFHIIFLVSNFYQNFLNIYTNFGTSFKKLLENLTYGRYKYCTIYILNSSGANFICHDDFTLELFQVWGSLRNVLIMSSTKVVAVSWNRQIRQVSSTIHFFAKNVV